MGEKPKTICVVGGGVVGISTALALHELGYKITIVEAGANLAGGASAQNGGQLSYSYVDALGSDALLAQMPKLALGLDPSFNINLAPKIARVRWLLSFLRNCTASGFAQNTLALLALAALSRTTLDAWRTQYSLDFDYRRAGKLLLCSQKTLAKHDLHRALKSQFGIQQEILSRGEALELEPFLKDVLGDFAGAIFSPDDAVGDAKLFVQEVAKVLAGVPDAKIYLGEAVKRVNMESDWLRIGRHGACANPHISSVFNFGGSTI